MYSVAFDPGAIAMVGVFSGDESSDDDYRRMYATTSALMDCAACANRAGVSLVVVNRGHRRANDKQRRIIAGNRQRFRADVPMYVGIITESMLIRNVIKVLDWLAPRPPGQQISAFETFERAILWAEEERGERIPQLWTLLAEARQRS